MINLFIVIGSGIEDKIGIYGTIKALMLGFFIIGFGDSVKIRIKHDLSYWIYVYQMVVINLIVQLGVFGRINHVFIAMICTIVLSVISYATVGYLGRRARNQLIEK